MTASAVRSRSLSAVGGVGPQAIQPAFHRLGPRPRQEHRPQGRGEGHPLTHGERQPHGPGPPGRGQQHHLVAHRARRHHLGGQRHGQLLHGRPGVVDEVELAGARRVPRGDEGGPERVRLVARDGAAAIPPRSGSCTARGRWPSTCPGRAPARDNPKDSPGRVARNSMTVTTRSADGDPAISAAPSTAADWAPTPTPRRRRRTRRPGVRGRRRRGGCRPPAGRR